MTRPLDITICIPTYNRAAQLRETLDRVYDHPIKFAKVMVSDNCSQDGTRSVLEEFKRKFDNFDFQVHGKNLGPMLNFHSLLSGSDTEFEYLLSDDDILHHDNILTAVEFLQENDFFSAIYGNFDAEIENQHKEMRNDLRVFKSFEYYQDTLIFDEDSILDNLKITPLIHPVFRTEAYKRYCCFDPHAFSFWKIMMQLLKFGPFLYMPISFFSHQATENRLEHQVHTPWYFSQLVADYELMLSESRNPLLTPTARQLMITSIQPYHYQYGHGDANWRIKDAALSLQYLRRMQGHGMDHPEGWLNWRQNLQLATLVQRLLDRIMAEGVDRLLLDPALTAAGEIRHQVGHHAPGIRLETLPDALPPDGLAGSLILFAAAATRHSPAYGAIPHRHCALFPDLLAQLEALP